MDGAGQWIPNLRGVRLVPFRLPTLKPASTVLIAEGEKDVLSLVGLGFVATCNPMGAGKWRAEYSDHFVGKVVVIFPDNDKPGLDHASKVAQLLLGKAASVRVAVVPQGKDVSDWIALGAGREQIELAMESATPFAGAPAWDGTGDQTAATDWREGLLSTDRGMPKPLLANAITALRSAPEWLGVLGFDEFSLETVALLNPPWSKGIRGPQWTDDEDRRTADWLQHQGIGITLGGHLKTGHTWPLQNRPT
ncbi:MAG: toprim domain-containing protein, partial [Acidobacteriota bacterium]